MTRSDTSLSTESDVEQKFVFGLLTGQAALAIPPESVRTKEYLPPTDIDKAGGKVRGYYPDYSIWISGFAPLIVEAKEPAVPVEQGFREACLYARHLNSRFKTGVAPTRFIMSTNGVDLIAGYWDQGAPALTLKCSDLVPGTAALAALEEFCGHRVLLAHAKEMMRVAGNGRGVRPFNMAGGQAVLTARLPLNSFAADLSPVLRRYFSSKSGQNITEIANHAYISSAETTSYDAILESLLKDRVDIRRDTLVAPLDATKTDAPALTRAISDFGATEQQGYLQIIQGAVGSGKSLFARRYRDVLEPSSLKDVNVWAFVDFNGSPTVLKGAEGWLAERIIESVEKENLSLDLYDKNTLKGIFSRQIQRKRAIYEEVRSVSEQNETLERAKNLDEWQKDPLTFLDGLSNYISGVTQHNFIIVLDNVDKLESLNQIDAFQLAQWLMDRTRAFVILQMRDETYERFKNLPPLDTYRSTIAFHISPPRFIDVVRRRLDLAVAFLEANAPEKQEYVLDNSVRVILPRSDLGIFLATLYQALFDGRRNIARVLEALAGRDVRKALEMFVAVVTSGHLSTSAITSTVRGGQAFAIHESDVLRILMRTAYTNFSDESGFVTNVFTYYNDWARPDNFLIIEVLYWLSTRRKKRESSLEGYFSVETVCREMERIGYDPGDVFRALNYLVQRELLLADNFNLKQVGKADRVKIQAAGFIHLRVLVERIEYLFGCIATTPVSDNAIAARLATPVARETERGSLGFYEKVSAVEQLYRFLKSEYDRLRLPNPFFNPDDSGAAYVLRAIEREIARARHRPPPGVEDNQLDLL